MAGSTPTPTPAQRAALLHFEHLHEAWRVADAALADAELRLCEATLHAPLDQVRASLGAETLRLRGVARAAWCELLGAMESGDEAPLH